jgi:hypothetical protein
VQVGEHPSHSIRFPSSHSSPRSVIPLPHSGWRKVEDLSMRLFFRRSVLEEELRPKLSVAFGA